MPLVMQISLVRMQLFGHITAKVLRDRSTNESTKVTEFLTLHCLSTLWKYILCDNMPAVFNIRDNSV
jgi:hypothetical protein